MLKIHLALCVSCALILGACKSPVNGPRLGDTETAKHDAPAFKPQGVGLTQEILARPFVHAASSSVPTHAPSFLSVCSFNIKWLGHYVDKDHVGLTDLLKDYDLVVVQELIASPLAGGGTRGRSKLFFDAMASHGFSYVLSESDTGKKGPLGKQTPATEWFVTFYKPNKVKQADDLPHGFISKPLVKHPDFVRVPYATAFRTVGETCDFVLVSVHLEPDDKKVRAGEFRAINHWLKGQYVSQPERDLIVLGDTNLQSKAELTANTPENFISLNDSCAGTNTSIKAPKPFDHVFFQPQFTTEIDRSKGFEVVNLVEAMRPNWKGPETYPGDLDKQEEFHMRYSDHNPVVFYIKVSMRDDD